MSGFDQSEWNGIYYDGNSGEFVTIDVNGGGDYPVALTFCGSDEQYEMTREEFCDTQGDFWRVPDRVVERPEEVLYEAAEERSRELPLAQAINVMFATEFTTAEATLTPPGAADGTSTEPATIPVTDDERHVLPDTLESQAEYVQDEAPGEAHVLWSHAEALRGDSDLFEAVDEEWTIPANDVEVIRRALDRCIDDLDAHSGPAFADSDQRQWRASILASTLDKLHGECGD